MTLKLRHPADQSCHAIVADDDDDTRALIAAALRRAGFEVSEASNGRELVSSFAALLPSPSVVVSDIGMPEVDGIAATIALRERAPDIPILLVTAFGDPSTVRDAQRAGANRVLLKPLNMSALVTAVLELVAKVPV